MVKLTPFSHFTAVCERLAATSKKLEKSAIVAEFLTSLSQKEISKASLFILGKVFADHDPRTLDVSWRTVQRISSLVEKNLKQEPISILDVYEVFTRVSETSGEGSRKKIEQLLTNLFNRAAEVERRYLAKIIFGEMRIGVAEGLLLEGIARAADVPLALVRRANMYLGDPGEVAFSALSLGSKGLSRIDLQLFRLVQPMLAGLAEDFRKIFEENGAMSLEYKFDGARVQIHKQKTKIKIYSRHLTDVTDSLPDLVETIKTNLTANSIIVEGEVVAIGKDERPLPFQELMRRFRRVHDIDKVQKEVPIRLYLFDLLFLNRKSFIDSAYYDRWKDLAKICNRDVLVNRLVTENEKEAKSFLQNALDAGHEGLMAKKLDSKYTPGARGKRWFKIKPAETLDLVIIAADWGSGRRTGWLSNYHLAARDETTGEFSDLGKTFKGLTDAQFRWMTKKLLSLKLKETHYTIFVKPELVVEVAYNEIQRSLNYNSGFALRFARIKRIRDDKKPAQADTMKRLRRLYEGQFARKAKVSNTEG